MSELPWAQNREDGVSIAIELAVYPLEIVLLACHVFTARCYVFAHDVRDGKLIVDFTARDANSSLRDIIGEFSNALLDATLRVRIAEETRTIRELLVAQAFCEADLLDRREMDR